jgi:hypothetical protein
MYLPSSHVETPVCDRNPEARNKKITNISEILRVIGKRGEGRRTYVKAQPNIDDLICAGMSSGPGIKLNYYALVI